MRETFTDLSEWTEFCEQCNTILKKLPDIKAELLEKAGDDVRDEVRRSILTAEINDAHGRVTTWQNRHVGSGRGYVAVRSDSVEVLSGGGGRNTLNAGALTNYLNSGHKVRQPSGRTRRYVPRAKITYVPGAKFYQKANRFAKKNALEAAKGYLSSVKEALQS